MSPGLFRFILALVVVLHHSSPLRLGSWAVYVFFILSGYWIARMWEDKYVHTKQAPWIFLVSRWWRLAPVFFTCLALAALVAATNVVAPMSSSLPPDLGLWTLRQLPIAGSAAAGRLLPPSWSLDVEMQFYALGAIVLPFLGLRRIVGPLRFLCWSVVAALLLLTLAFVFRGGALEYASIFPWVGLFSAGWVIHRTHFRPSGRIALSSVAILLLLLTVAMGLPESREVLWRRGADGTIRSLAETWRDHMHSAFLLMGAVILLPFIAWNVHQPSSFRDRLLGNWAYPLYLFHWIPRDWYYSVVNWSAPSIINIGLWLLNVTVALGGSFLILVLIDRPLDHWRARWVLRRLRQNGSSILPGSDLIFGGDAPQTPAVR